MGILEDLSQGMQGSQHYQDYDDFVNRYEQGHPSEGYSDEEVIDRYHSVARQVPQQVYQDSAYDAFNRLSSQERQQFGQGLQSYMQQQNSPGFGGFNFNGQDDYGGGDNTQRWQDPGFLAQMFGQLQQQNPELIGQILGGVAGGIGGNRAGGALNHPLAKAALAGITAMAAKRLMRGR